MQKTLAVDVKKEAEEQQPRAPMRPNSMDLVAETRQVDRKLRELRRSYIAGSISKAEYDKQQTLLRIKLKEAEAAIGTKAKEDPDWAKSVRFRLYENRTVQFLLGGFLGGMLQELAPDFDADRIARYPVLENIDGASATIDPTEILDDLVYAGILERRIFERFASCPVCRSHSQVFLRFKCPECGTSDLDSGSLIEHLVCGTVHEFQDCIKGDQLACPSCQEGLVEEGNDYRTVGTFSRCNTCKVHFEGPSQKFACRKCSHEFGLREASFYDTYTYALRKDLVQEAKSLVGLPIFKSALEGVGYRVEFPGTVTGSSGIPHSFTITAEKAGETIAVDLIESDSEIDEKEVLAFYAKVADAKSIHGILVAVPGFSKRAKEFARSAFSNGAARCLEAKGTAEAVDLLRSLLERKTE